MQVRFETFVLDSDTRELLRDGRSVPLSPKAFDLLSILVAERPKAISKSDLLERLWPATFVVEKNLANLVSEIRDALGDDPSGRDSSGPCTGLATRFARRRRRAEAGPTARSRRRRLLPREVGERPRHARRGRARARPGPRRRDLPELPGRLAASCADHDLGGPGGDRRPREQERDVCRGSARRTAPDRWTMATSSAWAP